MVKLLKSLLAVIVIIVCLTACEAKHVHTEVIDKAKLPTCTESGLSEGKHCSVCNEVIVAQQEIEALGHTEVVDEAKLPTCTESGLSEGKHCSVCNEVIVEQQEIEALGHAEVVDEAKSPTGLVEGLTEGKHCSVCNEVLVAQQTVAVLSPIKIDFPSGSITKKDTIITTDHLELSVPANVYIPDDLVENVNIVTSVMEFVSGMKFKGNPNYSKERLDVEIVKLQDTERELGPAYAFPGGFTISSGDLVDLFALIHEGSHSLQYNQSAWSYCIWAMEGISTYTTYKTQKYIEQNYPELIPIVGTANQSIGNYNISDYNELYKYPLEYWMENTFEFSGNNNYSIGFRFAWYLDEVYGDYTKWILEYEKANPYYKANANSDQLPIEEQIKAFKLAYGEDVFDGFYSWLRKNEELFNGTNTVDLSGAEKIQFYPMCAYSEITYSFWWRGSYNDLYIGIDAGRYYLNEYKGKSTNEMALVIYSESVVELYDVEGRLLRTEISQGAQAPISLNGVSFVKLVGSGTFGTIEIVGFENYNQ